MGIICLWGAPKPVDPNIVKFLFLVQLENYCLDLLGNTIVEILIFLLTLNCRMVQNHSKVFTMLDNTVSTYLFLSKSGLYVNDRCVLYPPIVESTMNSCMEPFSWNSPLYILCVHINLRSFHLYMDTMNSCWGWIQGSVHITN